MNSKFCYYNNYSSTHPRYFCKSCRRYWTKGGALRTIPFGSGARRRKSTAKPYLKFAVNYESVICGLELFQGCSFPPIDSQPTNNSILSITSMEQGLNFTLSSNESLSSINQHLYWKQQMQRLALLFGGEEYHNTQNGMTAAATTTNTTTTSLSSLSLESESQKVCEGQSGNCGAEGLFDSSWAVVDPVAVSSSGYSDEGIIEVMISNWINGVGPWSDFNQYGVIMP